MITALVAFAIGWVIHGALRRRVGWFRADLIWVVLCLCGAAAAVFTRSWSSAALWIGIAVAMLLMMRHNATCERCSA